MDRLHRHLGALLLLAACAPRVEKMRFADVFPAAPPEAPAAAPEPPAPPPPPEPKVSEVVGSVELQSALVGFAARARRYRADAPNGSPMPAQEVKNWLQLREAIDGFLRRSASKTSSLDVIRARVTLEAELEMDGRKYGDIPGDLAEDATTTVTQLAVRMAELRRIKASIREVQPRFVWPVEPLAVTSLFGRRFHPILKVYKQHSGLDLAAALGQPVNAAAFGTVVRAEWMGGAGNMVEISHGPNIITRYQHLSHLLVRPGDVVRQGDAVGLAGQTGSATGPHLHFELWRDGHPSDPLEELDHARHAPVAARASPLASR